MKICIINPTKKDKQLFEHYLILEFPDRLPSTLLFSDFLLIFIFLLKLFSSMIFLLNYLSNDFNKIYCLGIHVVV